MPPQPVRHASPASVSAALNPDEAKAYIRRHHLHALVDALVVNLTEHRPADPFQHMLAWLKAEGGRFSSASSDSRASLGSPPTFECPMSADIFSPFARRPNGLVGSPTSPSVKLYPMSMVREHNRPSDCWIVVDRKVYDVTQWAKSHPGGEDNILQLAGQDASAEFHRFHSTYAAELLPSFYVGDLEVAPDASLSGSETSGDMQAMSPDEWRRFPLVEVRPQTTSTRIFRFALPSPEHRLSCSPISHISVSVESKAGRAAERCYSPIATGPGWFDLLVKHYPGGEVGGALHSMCIGATLSCRGPVSSRYAFDGTQHKMIGMLAAGTGVTPMLQMINQLQAEGNPGGTQVTLLVWQRTEDDVLYRHMLERYVEEHPLYFEVHFFLTRPHNQSYKPQGRVTRDHLEELLPSPVPDMHVLVCGPDGFVQECVALLPQAGFTPDMWTVL
eukprot:EG_transcript_8180